MRPSADVAIRDQHDQVQGTGKRHQASRNILLTRKSDGPDKNWEGRRVRHIIENLKGKTKTGETTK